jgi:hypothetical protein
LCLCLCRHDTWAMKSRATHPTTRRCAARTITSASSAECWIVVLVAAVCRYQHASGVLGTDQETRAAFLSDPDRSGDSSKVLEIVVLQPSAQHSTA